VPEGNDSPQALVARVPAHALARADLRKIRVGGWRSTALRFTLRGVGATLEAPVQYLAPSPARLTGEPDEILVELVRTGEDRAFETIYDR
jgi:hypothetical protein